MPDIPDAHYDMVVKAIADGRVVPFLGAGVNLCGRPGEIDWGPARPTICPAGANWPATWPRTLATLRAKPGT